MNKQALAIAAGLMTATLALAAEGWNRDQAASGRVTYRRYCASCHGETGKGDGKIAPIIRIPVSDLTAIAAKNGGTFPTDKIAEVIDGRKEVLAHGDREMPVWGDALQHPERGGDQEREAKAKIDQLVEYVKSLQAK